MLKLKGFELECIHKEIVKTIQKAYIIAIFKPRKYRSDSIINKTFKNAKIYAEC